MRPALGGRPAHAWELLAEAVAGQLPDRPARCRPRLRRHPAAGVSGPAQLPRLARSPSIRSCWCSRWWPRAVAGLLFGAIPVVEVRAAAPRRRAQGSSRGSSEGRERHRARNAFVVAQVALAAVLLVASGLMVRTFLAIREVPPGFTRPEQILTMRISIPEAVVDDAGQVAPLHEQIVRHIEAVPGVTSVGTTSSLPIDGNNNNDPIWVEDFPGSRGPDPDAAARQLASARATSRRWATPLSPVRDLTWRDVHTSAPVALISDNLAREYSKDPARAIGRRIRNTPQTPWIEIVGVVGNDRAGRCDATLADHGLLAHADCRGVRTTSPMFSDRSRMRSARRGLQSPGFLSEVQQAVWSVNPTCRSRGRAPCGDLRESMAQTSFVLVILGIAAVGHAAARVVGIYGVIAYIVSQRRARSAFAWRSARTAARCSGCSSAAGGARRHRPGRRPGVGVAGCAC